MGQEGTERSQKKRGKTAVAAEGISYSTVSEAAGLSNRWGGAFSRGSTGTGVTSTPANGVQISFHAQSSLSKTENVGSICASSCGNSQCKQLTFMWLPVHLLRRNILCLHTRDMEILKGELGTSLSIRFRVRNLGRQILQSNMCYMEVPSFLPSSIHCLSPHREPIYLQGIYFWVNIHLTVLQAFISVKAKKRSTYQWHVPMLWQPPGRLSVLRRHIQCAGHHPPRPSAPSPRKQGIRLSGSWPCILPAEGFHRKQELNATSNFIPTYIFLSQSVKWLKLKEIWVICIYIFVATPVVSSLYVLTSSSELLTYKMTQREITMVCVSNDPFHRFLHLLPKREAPFRNTPQLEIPHYVHKRQKPIYFCS